MKVLRFLLLCSLLADGLVGIAQERSDDSVNVIGPAHCHDYGAVLDVVAQNTATDSFIIVIARQNENETRPNLNRRRLHNVRIFFTEFRPEKRASESVILAEGQRVKDHGRLEIYVVGKLTAVLKLKSNSDLIVGNCYPDPLETPLCKVPANHNFYPCLDRKTRRRKER